MARASQMISTRARMFKVAVEGCEKEEKRRQTAQEVGVAELEKRLASVQQDFTQALQKVGETENEKFDLIFAILVELQSRQAQLEESVRLLSAQLGGGAGAGSLSQASSSGCCSASGPADSPHSNQQSQQTQFGCGNSDGHQTYQQMPMGGQVVAQVPANQQQMQQFSGCMQTDGSQAMFAPVQQVVMVASPSGNGMQYAMPQMMFPNGAIQAMPVQYMGQGPNGEIGAIVNGQVMPPPMQPQIQQQQPQQEVQPQMEQQPQLQSEEQLQTQTNETQPETQQEEQVSGDQEKLAPLDGGPDQQIESEEKPQDGQKDENCEETPETPDVAG